MWVHGAATVLEATFAHSLNMIGTPVLVVEMGVGMRVTKEYCKQLVDGIFVEMKDLGMWQGEVITPKDPLISTDGEVDAFVAGVGTGGTITGVGEYLKSKNDKIEIIAVEPATSPVLSQGKPGPHKIQGIGAGFVPEILNTKIYDSVVPVDNDDAFEYARLISHTEGILVGISAGAALYAAIEWAKKPENEGKTIVALLPDSGDRYYSTSLFEN